MAPLVLNLDSLSWHDLQICSDYCTLLQLQQWLCITVIRAVVMVEHKDI